jgi:chromosome segregation and condensation protein ScpB
VSDVTTPKSPTGSTLEETIGTQASDVNLRQAVTACLCGGESRRWTISELVERFKSLGISASAGAVTRALAELEVELELSAWAPWRLIERGAEWILVPKSELMDLLLGVRALPVLSTLTETHKAVLLVVIGHRRKGGVSRSRISEILRLDPSAFLKDLNKQSLVYADPVREFNFWRPTPEALLELGLRSYSDIPAIKELEEWFEAIEKRSASKPDLESFFSKSEKLQARRRKRALQQRLSVSASNRSGVPQ